MVTKEILAKELRKPGLSYRDASVYIDAIINAIVDSLSQGKSIQIRGFGTFLVKKYAARNTSLNGNMSIPEHNKIIFRPCEKLRQKVFKSTLNQHANAPLSV